MHDTTLCCTHISIALAAIHEILATIDTQRDTDAQIQGPLSALRYHNRVSGSSPVHMLVSVPQFSWSCSRASLLFYLS
jgi:hypothetical protein